jgi:PAS domain S-box-containing protein
MSQSEPDSSARLAAIVASSEDAIIGQDLGGVITSWNDAAERMFGYPAEDAIGRHISMLIPADRIAEEDTVLAQVRAGVGLAHFETVRLHRTGAPIEVSLAVSPIRNPAGDVVGASKIVRDITRGKRLEREAQRLAAIVMSSDDAIVSKDLNGTIQSWNRGAERIFGWTADEVIGRSITVIIPKERLSEEDEVLSRIRQGLSVEHFETVRMRKDGSLVDISLTVSPVRTEDGRVVGASKIARDVTEQRRLAVAAEEASRLKDEFLAVLSHELRTPLNTVLGYARLLRRGEPRRTGEQRDKALDALERNADTLTRVVNDVLDTSRIVTGKLRLAFEQCAVDRLIEEGIDSVKATAGAKGVEMDSILDAGLAVMGDRDRLHQVVTHLLSNALKFSRGGGRVDVTVTGLADRVQLSVGDTGQGIDAALLPRVFDRFSQRERTASSHQTGLGLGLSIVKHLIEAHGGTVRAASPGIGGGATFIVELPATNQRPGVEEVFAPAAVGTLAGLDILLVDDDADGRELLATVLRRHGARVATAGSGAAALAHFARRKPDLILSDIGMPGQDGYSLLAQMRRAAPGLEIPAIAITAFTSADDRARAIAAGFQHHLAKPVDPDVLVATVARFRPRLQSRAAG